MIATTVLLFCLVLAALLGEPDVIRRANNWIALVDEEVEP